MKVVLLCDAQLTLGEVESHLRGAIGALEAVKRAHELVIDSVQCDSPWHGTSHAYLNRLSRAHDLAHVRRRRELWGSRRRRRQRRRRRRRRGCRGVRCSGCNHRRVRGYRRRWRRRRRRRWRRRRRKCHRGQRQCGCRAERTRTESTLQSAPPLVITTNSRHRVPFRCSRSDLVWRDTRWTHRKAFFFQCLPSSLRGRPERAPADRCARRACYVQTHAVEAATPHAMLPL
jgi:hypothetical protein